LNVSFQNQRRYSIRKANVTLLKIATQSGEKDSKMPDVSTNNEEYLKENSKRLNAQFKATTTNYISHPTKNPEEVTTFEHSYIKNTLVDSFSSDDNVVLNTK